LGPSWSCALLPTRVIHPASHDVLHPLHDVAIGNVRDFDADRGIEQHASEVIGAPDARRGVMHLVLVCLRVGDKLLQAVGWEVRARDQHQGLIGEEHYGCEICHGVVKWMLVEPSALDEGPDIADHELIAVGRGLGHAASADEAADAGDVLHHNGLRKIATDSVGNDARNGVARTSG